MADVRVVRYVAEHYLHLQGLRLVPLGVPFVASAVWRTGWLAWWPAAQGRGAAVWFWSLFAGGIAASFLVRRWYAARFGMVALRPLASGAVSLGVFASGLLFTIWCQIVYQLAVSLPLLFVAAVLATIACQGLYLRLHYGIIGILSAIVALLRPLGVSVDVCSVALDALIGGGLIAAGIADHRVLCQAWADAQRCARA